MLSGRRPFPGESYTSVLNAILSLDPDPLDSVNPQVPPEIVSLIHRMLEKDVSRRAASITVVREELETIVERMGLTRGRDLLRRYAVAPTDVTAALNDVRNPGPATTLSVSAAVVALLTRPDPHVRTRVSDSGSQETVVLDSATRKDATVSSSTGRAGPGDSSPRGSAPPVDATVAESFVQESSAARGRRDSAAVLPGEAAPGGPSRKMLGAIGGGVLLFAALVFAIFRFAGSDLDAADNVEPDSLSFFVTNPPPVPPEEIESPVVIDPDEEEQNEEEESTELEDARPEMPVKNPRRILRMPALPDSNVHPGMSQEQLKQIAQMSARLESLGVEAVRRGERMQAQQELWRQRETKSGQGKQYLLNSKPFAFIHVDGDAAPINPEGKPVPLKLSPGRHTFRAVNPGVVPPIDITFTYEVHSEDPNNSLILNLKTGAVEPRLNTALPY
jgi:hypothetical protein